MYANTQLIGFFFCIQPFIPFFNSRKVKVWYNPRTQSCDYVLPVNNPSVVSTPPPLCQEWGGAENPTPVPPRITAPVPVCANTPANMKHNMAPTDTPALPVPTEPAVQPATMQTKPEPQPSRWGTLCTVHAQTANPTENQFVETRRRPFLSWTL